MRLNSHFYCRTLEFSGCFQVISLLQVHAELSRSPEIPAQPKGCVRVQRGGAPESWKLVPTIGNGVKEIRIRDVSGQFWENLGSSGSSMPGFQKWP